jgi:hypothetical protein
MKENDILDLKHNVDRLDGHFTRHHEEVMNLDNENKRLLNLVFQLTHAVNTIPGILDDSSNAFRYDNRRPRRWRGQ